MIRRYVDDGEPGLPPVISLKQSWGNNGRYIRVEPAPATSRVSFYFTCTILSVWQRQQIPDWWRDLFLQTLPWRRYGIYSTPSFGILMISLPCICRWCWNLHPGFLGSGDTFHTGRTWFSSCQSCTLWFLPVRFPNIHPDPPSQRHVNSAGCFFPWLCRLVSW